MAGQAMALGGISIGGNWSVRKIQYSTLTIIQRPKKRIATGMALQHTRNTLEGLLFGSFSARQLIH